MTGKGIPIGVAVVGVLAFLVGLIWLLAGAVLLLDGMDETDVMIAAGISLVLGLAFLLFGLGCLKGWGWVWTFGVVLLLVSIIWTVYAWYVDDFSEADLPSRLISLAIPLLIILYMNSYKVKRWFGRLN